MYWFRKFQNKSKHRKPKLNKIKKTKADKESWINFVFDLLRYYIWKVTITDLSFAEFLTSSLKFQLRFQNKYIFDYGGMRTEENGMCNRYFKYRKDQSPHSWLDICLTALAWYLTSFLCLEEPNVFRTNHSITLASWKTLLSSNYYFPL